MERKLQETSEKRQYKMFNHTHQYPSENDSVGNIKSQTAYGYDLPRPNISRLKNKQLRREIFEKLKIEKDKEKRKKRKKRKLDDGHNAKNEGKDKSKQIPKTIENTREPEVTRVIGDDDEIALEESLDEMSAYYNKEYIPKVLITTSDRPHKRARSFAYELQSIVPNSKYYYRRGLDIKKIIPQALGHGYTDIIVINHDRHEPNGLVLSHLPDGPTANFRMSNVKFAKEIKHRAGKTDQWPELIMNNFSTRLGRQVGRMLAALFPQDPEFHGRGVVTFHNQRDYIFFRQHRYKFKSEKKCCLQEVGPRLTLRLQSLQKGTFDSKFGEYEWYLKRHEMETSRRRFVL